MAEPAGLELQKETLHAAEQSRPDVVKQRRQGPQRLAGVPATRLVFVDESGANTQMTRRCGLGCASRFPDLTIALTPTTFGACLNPSFAFFLGRSW